MNDAEDRHLTNVVAALTLAFGDRIQSSTQEAAGHAAAAPAALVALKEFLGGGSMDDLRRAVGLSPSGAVRLVDRLEADGYVRRQPGADARSVSLALTESGRSAAARVQAARITVVQRALAVLSEDERRSLANVADKLLSALTEQRLDVRDRELVPAGGWLCRLCDFAACGRDDGACPAATAAQSHYA